MSDREKLIEMLKTIYKEYSVSPSDDLIANYLISHGVTIREQGEWIEAHDNDGMDYECSNQKCRCRISYNGSRVSGDFNYCPNCGAKMDEVSE